MNFDDFFKSKTVWAGILAGGTQILNTIAPLALTGILGAKAQGIVNGLAIILGAVGVKSAISKVS